MVVVNQGPCFCCGPNCCQNMPEELSLEITADAEDECFCYSNSLAAIPDGSVPGSTWSFFSTSDQTCGGLDAVIRIWCAGEDSALQQKGKTYAQFHFCHAGEDPLGGDHLKEVTVHSCDPFHASVEIDLEDYRNQIGECRCNGTVLLEWTE